jgi:hypothetical protein
MSGHWAWTNVALAGALAGGERRAFYSESYGGIASRATSASGPWCGSADRTRHVRRRVLIDDEVETRSSRCCRWRTSAAGVPSREDGSTVLLRGLARADG